MLALASRGLAQAADQPDQKPATGISVSNIEAGFFDGACNIVRADAAAPISVQVNNRTGSRFDGTLQVISRDRDGETVIHELPGFGVDSGVIEDRQFSFFCRNPGMYVSSPEVAVRLLDRAGGHLVAAETVPLKYIKESDLLVLDVSPQSIKAVIQAALPDDPGQCFRGHVQTAYMRPDRLPQFWHELEAVDVIVCDQPDDLGLDERSAVLKVLAQWVRQGGSLVLGPGSLQSFGQSDLGKALAGRPVAARRVPAGKVELPGLNTSLTIRLLNETGVWQLRPAADATTLLALPAGAVAAPAAEASPGGEGSGEAIPVVVRRRYGMGSIVQSGVSLKNLLAMTSEEAREAGGIGTRIKPEIFGVRSVEKGIGMAPMSFARPGWPDATGPSDLLAGEADFRATGTVLAMLLMLLIAAYGLAATVGTWLVLKRRNLPQFSWLAFAGVAIIGSVGAGMLVQAGRGILPDVKQQAVIDLDGATGMAGIHTFFGLKMPYDARVDVALATAGRDELPAETLAEAYIRPASDLEDSTGTSFAVKREYTVRYGQTELTNVPVRATVKQFESYWHGPVGLVRASLAAAPAGQAGLAAGSWIANDTDLELHDCYLVYAKTGSLNVTDRDGMINVIRLDRLPARRTRGDLDSLEALPLGETAGQVGVARSWWKNVPVAAPGRRGSAPGYTQPAPVTSAASRMLAATMVSLVSEVPGQAQGVFSQGPNASKIDPYSELPREGGRWLDLRNVLDGRSALLLGMADVGGPMRLRVNGRVQAPSSGECIVRIALPLAGGN